MALTYKKPSQYSDATKAALLVKLELKSLLVYTANFSTLATLQAKLDATTTKKVVVLDADVDLASGVLTLPENTRIVPSGGSFSDGEVVGNNSELLSIPVKCFETTAFTSGTWKTNIVYPEQFGAIGDGATNDSFAFQHAANLVTQTNCEAIFEMLAKTYLLNPGSVQETSNGRIFFHTLSPEYTFKIKGQGKDLTFLKNTEQTWCGDLLSSVRAGSRDQTTGKVWYAVSQANGQGSYVLKDFTILETFQGATDGTGGCNPIGLVAPKKIIVEDVDIFNSGNRAIAFESATFGDGCEYVKIKNVKIKDTWKNAISLNHMNTGGCEVIIENVEIDGFNLLSNAGGSNINNNTALNLYATAGVPNKLKIENISFANGFAQLAYLRELSEVYINGLTVDNISVLDTSTAINQRLILFDITNDITDFNISNLTAKNVTHNTHDNWLLYGNLENMRLFNLYAKSIYGIYYPNTDAHAVLEYIYVDTCEQLSVSAYNNLKVFNLTTKNTKITSEGELPSNSEILIHNFSKLDEYEETDTLTFNFFKMFPAPSGLPEGWIADVYRTTLPYVSAFIQQGTGFRIIQSGAPSSKLGKWIKKVALVAGTTYQIRAKLAAKTAGTGVRVYLNATEILYLTDTVEATSSSFVAVASNTLELGGTAFNGDYTVEYVIIEEVV